MPTVNLNGASSPSNTAGTSSYRQTATTAKLPTGRVAANGNRPIRIATLGLHVSGSGGNRTARFRIWQSNGTLVGESGEFTIPSGSNGGTLRTAGVSSFFSNATGGNILAGWLSVGTAGLWIGRSSVTGASIQGSALNQANFGSPTTIWSNMTLAGYYIYWETPSAPQSVSVSPQSNGTSAVVSFSAPSDNGGQSVSGYNIQRATNSTFTAGVVTVASSTTSATITGLSAGTTYYYRVTAKNAISDQAGALGGTWSSTASAMQGTAPGAPVLNSVTVNSISQATAAWSAPSSNGGSAVTGYDVERATNSAFTAGTSLLSTTSLSQAFTGLSAGTTYYYRVRAKNAIGTGGWSNVISRAQIVAPSAPTLSSISVNSKTQSTAAWSAPSSNGGSSITGYDIQRSTNSGFSAGVVTFASTGLSVAVTGLSAGTTYYYRVRAKNSTATGPWSNTLSRLQALVPSAPSLTVTASSNGTSSTSSWSAPSDNGGSGVTGYLLQRATNSAFTANLVENTTTNLSFVSTGLSAGTTYYYRVRANNAVGGGAWSTVRTVGQPATPGAPTLAVPTTTSVGTSASLSWTAPSSNGGSTITGYRLERATNSAFTANVVVSTHAGTSVTVSGLTPGTTYYWRVAAQNAVGPGAWSVTRTSAQPGPPLAPNLTSVTPAGTGVSATLAWTEPANGGTAINKYYIQYATNSGFSQNVNNVITTGAPTTIVVTGLLPGTTYYWRVAARNAVTDNQGLLGGPWSNVRSVAQPTTDPPLGNYFDGTVGGSDSELDYSWAGTANASVSRARAPQAAGINNSIHDGYTKVQYQTGSTARFGSKSARYLIKSNPPAVVADRELTLGTGLFTPAIEGATYSGSIYVLSSRTNNMRAMIGFADSGGTYLAYTYGDPVGVSSSGWQRVTVTGVAPQNATQVAVFAVPADLNVDIWESGDTIHIDGIMINPGNVMAYFDGSFPDTADYTYIWEGDADDSVSTRFSVAQPAPVDPLIDPDCAPLIVPPKPPMIPNECIDEPNFWVRYWLGIPRSSVPGWLSTVPNVIFTTANVAIRQIRVRMFPNPNDLDPGDIDPDSWVEELILSYMPANTVLTVDSVKQSAYASVNGGPNLPADHLLYGSEGGPMGWPALQCGIPYYMAVDINDVALSDFRVNVQLTQRV